MQLVQQSINNTGRRMLVCMCAIFFVLFMITALRFSLIAMTGQVGDHDLIDMALNYHLATGVTPARRGTIFDRNGQIIASQFPSYTLFANLYEGHGSAVAPENITYTANRLSEVIDAPAEWIASQLSQPNVTHVQFGNAGRRLSFLHRQMIYMMDLDGIYFLETPTRFYPEGVFASHTIGYTVHSDDDLDQLIGVMGIELVFNDLLTGTNGEFQFLRDRQGFLQPNQARHYINEARNGYDIYLTIDAHIQSLVETALNSVMVQSNPEEAVAVVMNATTGEILAAGSRPTFNPNILEITHFSNAVVMPFEPGSTIKIQSFAAAANSGHFNGNVQFFSGQRELPGGQVINDFRDYWGMLTFNEGFYRSSNTAVIDLFRTWTTPFEFRNYLERFGFGQPTGFPLENEHPGTLPSIESIAEMYTAGFGQAFYATPIHQLQAITPFFNDGYMIRPQLIREIHHPDTNQTIERFEREILGRPIGSEAADIVRDLMIGTITHEAGTARNWYTLEASTSGGKTATAEMFDERQNITGSYVFSYIGFAPAENPEIVMFVAVRNPQLPLLMGHYPVGYIYRFVMNHTLRYLGFSNDVPVQDIDLLLPQNVPTPHLLNMSAASAIALIEESGLTPIVIGEGHTIFRQFPLPTTHIIEGEKVFIQLSEATEFPDFTGWTRAQVGQYLRLIDVEPIFNGQGRVTHQSHAPGNKIGTETTITITLE